jgi:acyl dehydratase
MREKAITGLQAGETFTVERRFSAQEVERFADMTRDYNPVHFDRRFTAAKGFRGPICHGLMVAAMISEIGGQIGWLASEMRFGFKKPVYPGDRVVCRLVVTEVAENGRAAATAEFRNQDGITVIEAALKGLLPGPRERQVMAEMVAEGDPSNKRR